MQNSPCPSSHILSYAPELQLHRWRCRGPTPPTVCILWENNQSTVLKFQYCFTSSCRNCIDCNKNAKRVCGEHFAKELYFVSYLDTFECYKRESPPRVHRISLLLPLAAGCRNIYQKKYNIVLHEVAASLASKRIDQSINQSIIQSINQSLN